MPSQGLHPWGCPIAVGHLAASQHPWLMARAQLVEEVLLAWSGLAWTDVTQRDPCLLPNVAFGWSHGLVPFRPHLPKAPAAQTPLCGLFSAHSSGSVPGRAALAGESSRKPEEQDKSFRVADQGLGAFLAPLYVPLSEGTHHLPAPSQAPAQVSWYFYYFYSKWHRTCCCSLQGLQRNIHTGIRQQGSRDAVC